MIAAALALASILAAPPWIGVALDKGSRGVKVTEVLRGPAERAGVRVGDEILAVDGQAVKAADTLVNAVQKRGVNAALGLHIARDGKELQLTVRTEERPDLEAQRKSRFVGRPAPSVSLATMAGPHAADLGKLKGQLVLLEFWATWCGPCLMAAPHLSALQSELGPRGLRIVAVTSDPWSKARETASRMKLSYTIAHDPEDAVAGRYGVYALPTYVLIGRDGVVRHWWAGHFDEDELRKSLD